MRDLWLLQDRFGTWELLLGDDVWRGYFSDNLRELDDRLHQLETDYLTLLEEAITMHATLKERETWIEATDT